ncbi:MULTISPECIES: ribbon-helix-helix domain-containing protein [unclassified Saccharibacter]|nr:MULTISPECIES: ribbon-helix-helix domain-containing protein [unclassified Saccharibacter]
MRLHGFATALRVEDIFWDILQTIARDSGLTLTKPLRD